MSEKETLIEAHSPINEIIFRFKTVALIAIRSIKNSFLRRTAKFPVTHQLKNQEIISISESDLWNADDTESNWILTAGKIQNLRIAAQKLHGTEVPANEVFSFWKHIGPPTTTRGYVIGREIREGCLVPAVAGGLCQLSNALYDTALKSGFEIIERHKHTKVVKGSLAEIDRDATVKWNYIDLRFRSSHPFRIETELSSDKLLVKFRSNLKKSPGQEIGTTNLITPSKLNDCYSCGNFECVKHPDKTHKKEPTSTTTFILDEKWSEYDEYIKINAGAKDHFISVGPSLFRSLALRISVKLKKNVFATTLKLDKRAAAKVIRKIPVESTHIVISQNLLPYVWEQGALGGRTFDVLMTRLPMEKLHERLDHAHKKYPQSLTLNDFRAHPELIDLENVALTKARSIITPHPEISDIFNNKSIKLNWKYPKYSNQQRQKSLKATKVLFPASSLARKGAYEMRQLAKELNLSVKVLGNATEGPSFWEGIRVEKKSTDPFEGVGLIVYPVYVEHQPRILLKAAAAGIPIVTTTASGLINGDKITVVPMGDYEALKQAVVKQLRLTTA